MTLRRTSHTVYDAKYHLVWAPKYRRWIERKDVRTRAEELFKEIANNHDMEIDTLEVAPDHVHIFLSFPPHLSTSKVVGMLKSISASVLFDEYPQIKKELRLWKGHFWQRGFFMRTVGDKVTAEVIRNYINYHKHEETNSDQL